MVIDIIVGILMVFAILRGWARGLLFQLGQAAWAVTAVLVSKWLGELLEPTIVDVGAPPHTASTIAFACVFLALYVAGSYLIHRTTKEIHDSSKTITKGDRVAGLFLGALKGAILIYVVFVVVIMTHRLTGKLPIPYASSHVGRFVVQHNFLDSEEFPRARALKALVKLGYIAGKNDSLTLIKNPHFQAVLMHPKAAVLAEPEVQKALLEQDWVTLVGHEGIWDFLDEPDIQEHLNAIETGETEDKPRPKSRLDAIPDAYKAPAKD